MARRRPKGLQPELPGWLRGMLLSGEPGSGLECASLYIDGLEARWRKHRRKLLREWIQMNPGTRPWAWWRYDAPRESVDGFEGTAWSHAPQRQRLGGQGRPAFEVMAYAPQFEQGIPSTFLDRATVRFYRKEKRDEGLRYKDAFNPADPPVYEAEATYLKRHGLLEAGEARRLKQRDFEPTVVELA